MLIKTCLRILGILLMIFSVTLLPPAFIALYYQDGMVNGFLLAAASTFFSGLVLWLPFYREKHQLRTRDGFLIVTLFWVALSFAGAIPLILVATPHIPLVDAVFESVSGFTTTGSTVLTGLDYLPNSIRYYRQQLHFIGGMGIIILAVAILPMLGIGGLQLYRAESTGPVKDKLTPRITETAKALWLIYVGLTIACTISFWLAGMSWFDAVCYAFSSVSTGGNAPHDQSIGFFNSNMINLVAVIFMFLGGVSFSLHFAAFHSKNLRCYWNDSEFRAYLLILAVVFLGVFTVMIIYRRYATPQDDLIHSLFHVVSMITTTGLTTSADGFSSWPLYVPVLLLIAGLIGGCANSTSGGIKVIRVLLMQKQSVREMDRLVHPNGQFIIKINDKPVPDHVLDAIWGFMGFYLLVFALLVLALMATGLNFISAWSGVAATIANIGPGLGGFELNYSSATPMAKWLLSASMLIGRLEIFTIFVLLSPTFWRD